MTELMEKPAAEQTDAPPQPVYCFICTGNTCRSPMAEALFNRDYPHLGHAVSAGLAAAGEPISPLAVAALREEGIPVDPARLSRPLTPEVAESSALLLCMTAAHAFRLTLLYPALASRIRVMPGEIPDPFGGDEAVYRETLRAIRAGLTALFGAPPEADE